MRSTGALTLLPMGVLIGGVRCRLAAAPRARLATWAGRTLCAGLCVWIVVQFNEFIGTTSSTTRSGPLRGSTAITLARSNAIVQRYGSDDRRFIYLSNGLPRIREQWKLYLLGRGRRDLLSRTVVFTPQDLHLEVVRAGSLLLTGADDPVERWFQKMPEVRATTQITEPDGTPSLPSSNALNTASCMRFDGIYAAEVKLTCAPGRTPTTA